MVAQPLPYAVGTRIPKTSYVVRRVIASGGMATVYEVRDDALGRVFALKCLHPELASEPELRARLRHEGRLLGRLCHPNIVTVFTAGTTGDDLGLPYLVLEHLRGESVRAEMRRVGALGVRRSLRITLDVLSALEVVHERGLLHRDVKPDNVVLHAAPDGTCVTKLLDFGVADELSAIRAERQLFCGTLRYASPEQIAGRPLDARSDLYAVGLMLFEMLAGTHPFHDARGAEALADARRRGVRAWPRWNAELRRAVASALEHDVHARASDAFTLASLVRRAAKSMRIDLRRTAHETEQTSRSARVDTVTLEVPIALPDATRHDATLDVDPWELHTAVHEATYERVACPATLQSPRAATPSRFRAAASPLDVR